MKDATILHIPPILGVLADIGVPIFQPSLP
jgi:hypothetical protein